MEKEISIKEAANELLDTNIFKTVVIRNGDKFAMNLALWVVGYILLISSMKENLEIGLEMILIRLHGEHNFKKIVKLIENMYRSVYEKLNIHI